MADTRATDVAGERYARLAARLDEHARRLLLGSEAIGLGPRSTTSLARVTGVSRRVIARGIKEVQSPEELPPGRIRKVGGGRKKATDKDPTLLPDLERLVEPVTRGDPMSALQWTSKSLHVLSAELTTMGHQAGPSLVQRLLHHLGYSLQANRKTLEGATHVDRDAQFEHINAAVNERITANEPVISVDTKKKELVGPFKNSGKALRPKGNPEAVNTHDFPTLGQGKANPYGVYDIGDNTGWVNVGIDHDTSEFAVESIRRWLQDTGHSRYPDATTLMITADCGGSNGYRGRLWKVELQRLADETGLAISVSHFPPGTSKWNKIEHRLFSFITQNWQGKPLVSYQVIINLISATRTTKGLKVKAVLDTNTYEKGRTVSDEELARVNLTPDPFHGEWNYTISPATKL